MQNVFALQAMARAGAHQSVGALFTTPDEVETSKNQLRPAVEALHNAFFNGSAAAPAGAAITQDFINFSPWYAAWNSFWSTPSSILTASSDMDRLTQYTTELQQWQAIYQKDAAAANEAVVSLPAITQPADSGGILGNAANTVSSAATTQIGTVAKIAAVAGVAFLAIEFGPEFFALAKRLA